MKHYLLILSLLGLPGASAAARPLAAQGEIAAPSQLPGTPPQERPAGPRPGGQHGEELFKDLDLTAKQQAKEEVIFKNQQQQLEALRGSTTDDREKAMSNRRRIESQTDAKLKTVLSSEQYAKYQAKKQEHPHPPKDGQRPPRQKDSK